LFSRVSALAMEVLSAAAGAAETAPDMAMPHQTSLSAAAALSKLRQGASSTFQLHLTVTDHMLPSSVPAAASNAPAKAVLGSGTSYVSPAATSTRCFLISQCSASGATVDLALDMSKHLAAPLVPWGAVAADITSPQHSYGSPAPGQAFCFLPLPALDLGLPVHINGFFELSSNRR
jgi:hypothetical protein